MLPRNHPDRIRIVFDWPMLCSCRPLGPAGITKPWWPQPWPAATKHELEDPATHRPRRAPAKKTVGQRADSGSTLMAWYPVCRKHEAQRMPRL